MLHPTVRLLSGAFPQGHLLHLPEDVAVTCTIDSASHPLKARMRSRWVVQSLTGTCNLQEDIVNALALTGQVLMGQAVMVKSSEVSKLASGRLVISNVTMQSAEEALLVVLAPCTHLLSMHPEQA